MKTLKFREARFRALLFLLYDERIPWGVRCFFTSFIFSAYHIASSLGLEVDVEFLSELVKRGEVIIQGKMEETKAVSIASQKQWEVWWEARIAKLKSDPASKPEWIASAEKNLDLIRLIREATEKGEKNIWAEHAQMIPIEEHMRRIEELRQKFPWWQRWLTK